MLAGWSSGWVRIWAIVLSCSLMSDLCEMQTSLRLHQNAAIVHKPLPAQVTAPMFQFSRFDSAKRKGAVWISWGVWSQTPTTGFGSSTACSLSGSGRLVVWGDWGREYCPLRTAHGHRKPGLNGIAAHWTSVGDHVMIEGAAISQ